MSAAREQRLRLRLRIVDSPVRAKVNVPATCTLEQLKAAVRAELPGLDAEYGLSSNKKAMLTDAAARLTALGVCSGDLLWVHSGGGAAAMECDAPVPHSATAAASPPAGSAPLAAAMPAPRSLPPRDAAGDAAEERSQAAMQAAAKRQKAAAASAEAVPEHHAAASMPQDDDQPLARPSRISVIKTDGGMLQLAAALHAIALDCGLQGADASPSGQCDTLPVAAQPSANSISLRYCLVGVGAAPVASAMVHCSRMGRHALLAGRAAVTPGGGAAAVAAGAAHHVSLPWQPLAAAAAASNGDGGAALAGAASAAAAGERVPLDVLLAGDAAGFVTALKDGLLLPLLADLCRAAGVAPPFGLLSLPSELQRSVLGLLGAEDLARLSCVCAELRDGAGANDVWRPLFEAEFGDADLAEATAGARGWKSLFHRRWRNREEYRSARRRPMRFPYVAPPTNPLRPFGGGNPPGTPFIIGGDRDRLPLPFQPFGGRGGRGGRGSGGMFGGTHFY